MTTGVYYTDQQLAGPYVVQTQVHNLYPPHALYLFIPFLPARHRLVGRAAGVPGLCDLVVPADPVGVAGPPVPPRAAEGSGPDPVRQHRHVDRRVRGRGGALVMAGRPGVDQSRRSRCSAYRVCCRVPGGSGRRRWSSSASRSGCTGSNIRVITQNSSAQSVVLLRQLPVLRRADRRVDGLIAPGRHARQSVVPGLARAPETRSELTVGQIAPDVDRRLCVAIRKTPAFRLGPANAIAVR